MTYSTYFDLLKNRAYFETFLKRHNSQYSGQTVSKGGTRITLDIPDGMTEEKFMKIINRFAVRKPRKSGEEKEHHYGKLIKRYYGLGEDTISTELPVTVLIENEEYFQDAYESLKEFGMKQRGATLVPFPDCWESVKYHRQPIERIAKYKMDNLGHDGNTQKVLGELRTLFHGLNIVPENKRRLVSVSKMLHFLLPDLVMPIDSKVLRFVGKGEIPGKVEKQFEWFQEVFNKYVELTAQLGLKRSNGDGNWWNISVPKRIDNAIMGFWDLFNDKSIECIICGHIDMLLKYLKAGNQSV